MLLFMNFAILVHHDHTQKFIDLQTKEMKDWEKWKMKLEKLLPDIGSPSEALLS